MKNTIVATAFSASIASAFASEKCLRLDYDSLDPNADQSCDDAIAHQDQKRDVITEEEYRLRYYQFDGPDSKVNAQLTTTPPIVSPSPSPTQDVSSISSVMKTLEDVMPAMAAQGVDVESLIQQMGITTSISSPSRTNTFVIEITGAPAIHDGLKAKRDDGATDAIQSMWCTQMGGTYAGNGDCQNATTSSATQSSSSSNTASSNTALRACNAVDAMFGPGGDFDGVCQTASSSSTSYTAMPKRSAEFSTFKTFTSSTEILPGSLATDAVPAPSSTLATVRKRGPQPNDIAAFDSVPPKAPGLRRGAAGENSTGFADTVKHEAESVAFKAGALFGRSASPVMTRIGAAVGTPGDGASGLNSTAAAGTPVFRRSNGTLPGFRRDMWGSLDLSRRNDSSQLMRRSNDSAAAVRRGMLSPAWYRRNEGNAVVRRSSVSGGPSIQARNSFWPSRKKASTTSSPAAPGSTSPANCVGAKKSLLPWPRKKNAKCASHHGDTLGTPTSSHQCDHEKPTGWRKYLPGGRKKHQIQQHCLPVVGGSATPANHAHMGGVPGSTGERADGHPGSDMDHVADFNHAHGGAAASHPDASTHDIHDPTETGGVTPGSDDDGTYDPNGASGHDSGDASDTTGSSTGDGTSDINDAGMGSSGHGDQHDSTGSGDDGDGAGNSTGDDTSDGTGDGTIAGSSDGDGGFGAGDGSGVGSGSGDSSFKTKRDTERHLLDDAEELDADEHALVTRRNGGEDSNVEESDSGLMERDAAADEDDSLEADNDYENAQVKRDGRHGASRPQKRPGQSTASSRLSKAARKQKCKNGFNGFNRCLRPKCLPGQQLGPKCDCYYGISYKGTCLQDGTPYKACGMGVKPQQSCLFAQVDNTGMVSKMVSTNKLKSGGLQSCQLGQRLTGKCACLLALNGKCMRIPTSKRLRVKTFKASVLDADHAIGGAHGNMRAHAGPAGSPASDVHQGAGVAPPGHDANDGDNAGQSAGQQQ